MIGARCAPVNPSGMTTSPPPGSRPRALPLTIQAIADEVIE
jgi:hypothetical protein